MTLDLWLECMAEQGMDSERGKTGCLIMLSGSAHLRYPDRDLESDSLWCRKPLNFKRSP